MIVGLIAALLLAMLGGVFGGWQSDVALWLAYPSSIGFAWFAAPSTRMRAMGACAIACALSLVLDGITKGDSLGSVIASSLLIGLTFQVKSTGTHESPTT